VSGVRPWATVSAAVVALVAVAVVALAFTATPASAYSQWEHDAATCDVCHAQGTPTDATCQGCHTGFQSYPGMTCWSCHAPGQDTSTLSTPSSACSQECHLWNSVQKQYIVPSTHGANPHLGSTTACLDCHPTSVSWDDPGSSPHHQGTAPGFTECGACHSSQQNHAGKVACASCHKDATAFHLYQASSPGFKKCGSCHSMKHAGVKVSTSKCAGCHKGSGGRPAQHSSSITRNFVCSGCHSQKLHAHAVSKAVKNCRTCHGGKYHAAQHAPAKSVCTRCHSSAARHANGFQCTLCHRRAVHATRPSAVN
jgi:hypothetical protein